ncbi:dTMP kinase [Pleionea sp. CnH1-48]|uniref:dTMP kinase n=1 Tax=Pleionea sp. CnH1-48 TaxID=2954494 RepID=UPI00209697FD|nr:dTMP kinase [Pleionea sp. CnH1-48]MCO7225872.1 dTMP kinase [Pleionea sp. CnH1-48]
MKPGQFITIEGGEGVGKTTNIQFVESLLQQEGIEYLLTREPGGTPFAEEIRELLLAKRDENVSSDAELLLMFAARAQHVAEKIKPALAKGSWVIGDRFTDASFAYQGGGRGIDWARIEQLEQWTLQSFKPCFTLLLDVDPQIGMQRAANRGELDRFEIENLEFFNQVRAGYQRRVAEDPERFALIDASVSLEQVQEQIKTQLLAFIKRSNQD